MQVATATKDSNIIMTGVFAIRDVNPGRPHLVGEEVKFCMRERWRRQWRFNSAKEGVDAGLLPGGGWCDDKVLTIQL